MKLFEPIEAMRALGEKHRLKILRLLLTGEYGVNEIGEALQISQYNASRHLRVLREAGLVEYRKVGRLRLNTLAPEIRKRTTMGGMVLDLGCCQFDFRMLPE